MELLRDMRTMRILLSDLAFSIVEYATWTAILLYAYDARGPVFAGIVAAVQHLPAALIAPLLLSPLERMSRSIALGLAYGALSLALFALAAGLTVGFPILVNVAISAVAVTFVSVVRPLHFAALPHVCATPGTLVSATAASGMFEGVGLFVGPISAGLAMETTGVASIIWASALAMGTACLLVSGLGLSAPAHAHGEGQGIRQMLGSMRLVGRDRAAFGLIMGFTAGYFTISVLDIVSVNFAHHELGLAESAAGLLLGAPGIGAFFGGVVAAFVARRDRLALAIVGAVALAGVSLAMVLWAESLLLAVVFVAGFGGGQAFTNIAGRTLLQRSMDERLLIHAFSFQESAVLLGLSLGSAVAPLLLAAVGPSLSYVVVGGTLVAVSLILAPHLRKLDARSVLRPQEISLLRTVSFLSGLTQADFERLARHAMWVDAPVGTEVITQGDSGDAFFAIESGECKISVNGVGRPHTLGPGDFFGEIALLRDVPRTATVTTVSDARLLKVDRELFLAVVTKSASGSQLANEVISSHLERDRRLTQ